MKRTREGEPCFITIRTQREEKKTPAPRKKGNGVVEDEEGNEKGGIL